MQNAYTHNYYQQTNITTANRGELVIKLYEGAINFLKKAKICIVNEDIPGKCNNINRADDIIQELNYSLKTEEAEEISNNLRGLYFFMQKHLVKAKIDKEEDTRKIDEVISLLSELKEAWEDIMDYPEVKEVIKGGDEDIKSGFSSGITV